MFTDKLGGFFQTTIKVFSIVDVADPSVQFGILQNKFQEQFLNFSSVFHAH